jgi:hypothetical protein
MQYALAYQLNGTQASGLDPDAKAYILAVEAAGATVSSIQRNAINNFYKTGKSQGWYSGLKRIFLPIWGIASPNAIDMVVRSSGTFVGTVTHASGYIQGDGSSGYLNTNANQSACSITTSSGYYLALAALAATGVARAFCGAGSSGNTMTLRAESATSVTARHYGLTTGQITSSTTNANGIISFSRQGGNRTIWRRSSSTRAAIAGPTAGADSGSTVTANIFALAGNNSDTGSTPTNLSNARVGVLAFGSGVSDSTDADITSAVKTLWETCTGLTIP